IDDALAFESNFTLSMPFVKQPTAAQVSDTPSSAELERLALLLTDDDDADVSAEVAERDRIAHPEPTIFLPGNKQRQARSILTIVVSIVTVLALIGVGVLFAVKSQAASPAQQAFDAYAGRQLAVAKADRSLTSTFERFGAVKAEADALNIAAAAALAAVAGVSNETERQAADAVRLTFAATVAEVTAVDPAETPYVAPDVTAKSNLTTIAAGLDEVSAEATRIEAAQLELDTAVASVRESRRTFTDAFSDFAATIPATATALITANPDAAQEWRDAVATSVNALTAAVKDGFGVKELQAYGASAFALQDENARVLAEEAATESDEDSSPQTPSRPRSTPDDNDEPANPVTPKPPKPENPKPADPDPVDPDPVDPEEPAVPDLGID
ncbi:MAG: hypothetical protein ABWX92_07540, partial [Mycetocola sp.]